MLAADDPVENNGAVPDEISRAVDPRVNDALAKWITETGISLDFDRWITPGLSGALLATVVLNGPDRAALGAVMKICPPGRITGKEAERHAEALTAVPRFAAEHLVTQPIPPVIGKGGWIVMFQEVAGGSLRTIRPLSTMGGESLSSASITIIRSILSDWNQTAKTIRKAPVPFFREHFGTRLVEGGPLDQFAQQIVHAPPTDSTSPSWVRTRTGAIVPNAVAWARSDIWLEDLKAEHLMVIVGCAHGDLHADNILVPQKPLPAPARYRLIDLAAFSSSSPLSRDPSHLLLSLLVSEVAELTDVKRQAVARFLIDPFSGQLEHLQIAGLLSLIKGTVDVGEEFANELQLVDHWQDQTLLSLAANALLFAIRLKDPSMRLWCLELSCGALGRFCAALDIAAPTDAPLLTFIGTQSPAAIDTEHAFERFAAACTHWTGTRTTILVVDSSQLTPDARAKISALRWKIVVDLNPSTDVDGGWAFAIGMPGDRRLFTNDQDPFFGRSSTVWLAAAGLSDADPVYPGENLRVWRRTHFRFIAKAVEALAQASSHPATVVCMGEPRSAERAIVETCVDAFGDRVDVVVVAVSDSGTLAEYGAQTILCQPSELLQVVPKRIDASEEARGATLPGRSGLVPVPSDLVSRYADTMDLLHSEIGITDQRNRKPGAFYRGNPISWYELNLGLDVERYSTSELVNKVLRPSLNEHNTRRVMLTHTPGAGGTTIARRAAWDLKDEYPTVYLRGDIDESVFVQAVSELAQLCDISVLVVAELVPDATVRNVFDALRANTVPVVLLITTRRTLKPRDITNETTDSGPERRPRSIHVGTIDRQPERLEIARRFADLTPQRNTDLLKLAARPGDNNVPFFYALTAFGTDFEGLQSYVAQFLVNLSEQEREVAILISMCHLFCGVPVPAELFAELLDVPPSADIELAEELTSELSGLLVEELEGTWRTTHSLIAEETLKQILSPAEGEVGREDWKAPLTGWSLRLIHHAKAVFGRRLPADMKSIVDRLFTTRESREPIDVDSVGSATYTDLMQALSSAGRLQVLNALVAAFPDEPHYWAHLGRFLSYDVSDFSKALTAVDRAIALSPKDSLLHHMRGMVFRNEMRARIRDKSHGDAGQREGLVLDLCQSAGDAFRTVSQLNDATEYGHIALAQTNIAAIEYGYALSGCSTYAQFLSRPTAGRYRDLLADAEESLEAAREIRGPDRASFTAETVEIQLRKLYDDYSALLQGWRNLLDRAELAKPPIRRRLARLYHNRAGSWRQASTNDLHRAVDLLEENLLDNPRDARSILEWLRAARFAKASLDHAADLVAGWARTDGSREALFYDYVISYLLAMDGQETAVDEYKRKVERCRERAAWFGNRRFPYEWLGQGAGLGRLIHHSDLPTWERRSGSPAPAVLLRVPGRVQSITKPTAGTIDFGRGLHTFFAPSASGLLRGRDENRRVITVVAFRYDGPIAFIQQAP